MNIVTQFPVNLNLNLAANPNIEAARKEALSREVVSQAAENEQSPAGSGTGSDNEKTAKRGLNIALTYDFSKLEQHKQLHKQEPALADPGNQPESNNQDATEDQENRGQEFTRRDPSNPGADDTSSESKEQEEKQLEDLKARDQEVRTHEQAHANIGGQYAGSPQYEFERGSDGKNYAVEGEVQIDVSTVPGDPQATIQKMDQVKRAALAPAEPSSADRKVANEASQKAVEARAELQQQQAPQPTNAATASINEPATADANVQPESVAGIFSQDALTRNQVANEYTGPASQNNTVPQFEPKQTLAQSASLNIEQRDQNINARALKIQRFYQQSYSPSEINFTRYA